MTQFLFKNFHMLDPEHDELRGGYELLVEGARIREVSAKPIKAPAAEAIDCGGRTLMPGLIDSHVHVVLSEVSIPRLENVPLTLMTARAAIAAMLSTLPWVSRTALQRCARPCARRCARAPTR
jgi:imidazolonepropionase-like amidohydrolase